MSGKEILRSPAMLGYVVNALKGESDETYLRGGAEVMAEAAQTGDVSAAIEAQEARGQAMLCASEMLPKEVRDATREQLEQIGFVFGEDVDDLFVRATLPPGWSLAPTDHSMWSDLRDERGRKRGGIFYKAAFYDRRAAMRFVPRYSYGHRPVGGWNSEPADGSQWEGYVSDGETDIFVTDLVGPEPKYEREDPAKWMAWHGQIKACEAEARAWLDSRFPHWRDPFAYWNEE